MAVEDFKLHLVAIKNVLSSDTNPEANSNASSVPEASCRLAHPGKPYGSEIQPHHTSGTTESLCKGARTGRAETCFRASGRVTPRRCARQGCSSISLLTFPTAGCTSFAAKSGILKPERRFVERLKLTTLDLGVDSERVGQPTGERTARKSPFLTATLIARLVFPSNDVFVHNLAVRFG
jgi:hypothetical protein